MSGGLCLLLRGLEELGYLGEMDDYGCYDGIGIGYGYFVC